MLGSNLQRKSNFFNYNSYNKTVNSKLSEYISSFLKRRNQHYLLRGKTEFQRKIWGAVSDLYDLLLGLLREKFSFL
jgi:hypothetical protein